MMDRILSSYLGGSSGTTQMTGLSAVRRGRRNAGQSWRVMNTL